MKTCTITSPFAVMDVFLNWVFNERRPRWWRGVGRFLKYAFIVSILSLGFFFLLGITIAAIIFMLNQPAGRYGPVWYTFSSVGVLALIWLFIAYCCCAWNEFLVPWFSK
jgi:hypothetical protein